MQMMLGYWFCHELLNALPESAINQQVWAGMIGLGKALGVE
jgi:hypothetical protein